MERIILPELDKEAKLLLANTRNSAEWCMFMNTWLRRHNITLPGMELGMEVGIKPDGETGLVFPKRSKKR